MSFEGGAGLRQIKTIWRLALLKLDFESKIYTRAVDLKRYPCLCGDLSSHRIVFVSRSLKAAILPAHEALRALLSAL